MALRLVATKRARRDLHDLFAYIAADNPSAANAMQGRIDKALRLLTVRPFIGPSAGLRSLSLRRFSVPPYIIFYKPRAETLAVVRVVHSLMDITRQHIAEDGSLET